MIDIDKILNFIHSSRTSSDILADSLRKILYNLKKEYTYENKLQKNIKDSLVDLTDTIKYLKYLDKESRNSRILNLVKIVLKEIDNGN